MPIDATGLSAGEAARRLAAEGPNQLPATERRNAWRILRDVLREPMFALLLAAGVLYGLIGDLGEALVLFAFASLSVLISAVQQGRSERVLDALRDLSSPRALVVRDGLRQRIPGREVVRGDLLVLVEGDRVAADGVLVEGAGVQIDESLLTGESVPVSKLPVDVAPAEVAAPGGDQQPFVYSGTLIVRGNGLALATATGPRTQIGQIGHSLGAIDTRTPRLYAQARRLILWFALLALSLSAGFVLLYGLLRGNWIEAVLSGIALGMSMLPEEFPLVLTVFMVMAAWRLSMSGVLTRQAAAIETLGAATVLCTDKTGTLTRNQMTVCRLAPADGSAQWHGGPALPDIVAQPGLAALLSTARLASEAQPVDPMEQALDKLSHAVGIVDDDGANCLRKYPLTSAMLVVTHAWTQAGSGSLLLAAKGAPEAIARLCGMDERELQALHVAVQAMAGEGIRVLGVARARSAPAVPPEGLEDLAFEFLGLVGFRDPLRESVPAAVHACREAGIRIIMITGDYPATARAIAQQAGLAEGEVLTGAQVAALSDAELAQHVQATSVFARITPAQKLRIVEALRSRGEVVAMTGDGVNDAPALKTADIGIAMGGRGTDVAREASSIVLLQDDFGSIVEAVRLGRRTYDNIRKSMGYLLAIHVPIAGMAIVPVLAGHPLLLTPVLIAFLELIIDPTCSLAFEAEPAERDVMRRPPRDPAARLLSTGFIFSGLLQGVFALLFACAVFFWGESQGLSDEVLRTLVLVLLVGVNLTLIFANRSQRADFATPFATRNPLLWGGLVVVLALLALLLGLQQTRSFAGLGELPGVYFGLCLAMSVLLFAIIQGFRFLSKNSRI